MAEREVPDPGPTASEVLTELADRVDRAIAALRSLEATGNDRVAVKRTGVELVRGYIREELKQLSEREEDPHRGHVERTVSGQHFATCSCGWMSTALPWPSRVDAWLDHDDHRGRAEAIDGLVREPWRLDRHLARAEGDVYRLTWNVPPDVDHVDSRIKAWRDREVLAELLLQVAHAEAALLDLEAAEAQPGTFNQKRPGPQWRSRRVALAYVREALHNAEQAVALHG
jgi:hypothetical protein